MKKILIADDEARIRRLVCDFLKNAGFETVEAVDGKETYDSLVLFEEKMLPDSLTLRYSDGTSEEFKISLPPENDNVIFPVVSGARDNYKFHIRLYLRKPVNAAKVVSAELNGIELFVSEQ